MKDTDLRLFCEGNCNYAYKFLGSFPNETGVQFALWAPNARQVQVIGSFNHWNGSSHRMDLTNEYGIWTLTVPEAKVGDAYQYRILTENGTWIQKADPYAKQSASRSRKHSLVSDFLYTEYTWQDEIWMAQRKEVMSPEKPMHIYEVHCSSFHCKDFQTIAEQCIPYMKQMHYNFIELMPVMEHPMEESRWYQTTGYFSILGNHGTPADFRQFVEMMHQAGIGVILDWVPSHFARDTYGLVQFDGTCIYEGENKDKSWNPFWGTHNFDFSKGEVQSFLLSSAFYFLEEFHIDGLRVDSVSNLLYHGNKRYQNPNLYNAYGGLENIGGIDFIKKLNRMITGKGKGAITIAEEESDWENVTRPDYLGGLGFSYTWNTNWMHDSVAYMQVKPAYRQFQYGLIKKSLLHADKEKYCMALSHAESSGGKGSLLSKMPDEDMAQLRVLLGYQMTHPGKKLTFMGNEFGETQEWKAQQIRTPAAPEKMQMLSPSQQAMLRYTETLNRIYMEQEVFWSREDNGTGFTWVVGDNDWQSILAFMRKGKTPDSFMLVVLNFSDVFYESYKVGVPRFLDYEEVLNSDAVEFGGRGFVNEGRMKPIYENWNGQPFHIEFTIPANSMLVIRPIFEEY